LINQKVFWSLDLELNTPDRSAKSKPDNGTKERDIVLPARIIQVGVSVGMWPSCSILYTEAKYLKVNEYIHKHITDLTGITDEHIRNEGLSHLEIKKWLLGVKEEYGPVANPVTWGHGDLDELAIEMEMFEPFTLMGHRPIDVKTIFTFKQIVNYKSSKLGLKGALGRYGLGFQGLQHRADVDAMNTLRLFFHMLHMDSQIQHHLVAANALLTGHL
jgi:DNA polymerase III alpha subunit (gram-positive type)